ncbi:hypothetical protein PVK06_041527 [Gossypium arboreum]|uniref:Uncharacterized protein n=1 Tax=Gossypium arboreum TaxID=29729 RepID=A0ABR0N923_GOSAR|nr:hypothetical protein PVK06_041527 [Gossypium arboreum]
MELTLEFCSTFLVQQGMAVPNEPGTISFQLGGLVRQMIVPEFSVIIGLYIDEFMSPEDFLQLHWHIHHFPSHCWADLIASQTLYNASHSKATSLSLTLRYILAVLAHTLTGQRESTGVVSTHGTYFLWSMVHGHIFDLAYFIALAFYHQNDRHRKGPIYLGPYVTRLARHFNLIDTLKQSSTLTLVSLMSSQGISNMIHIWMIERFTE